MIIVFVQFGEESVSSVRVRQVLRNKSLSYPKKKLKKKLWFRSALQKIQKDERMNVLYGKIGERYTETERIKNERNV